MTIKITVLTVYYLFLRLWPGWEQTSFESSLPSVTSLSAVAQISKHVDTLDDRPER